MKLTKGNRIPVWICNPCTKGFHRKCKESHMATITQRQVCICHHFYHNEYKTREALR